jgi:DNA topoisomerase-1
MEKKNETSSKSKKKNDSPQKKNNKVENNKDTKIKNKMKKILSTQGVSDIISVNRWWEKEDVNVDTDKRWETLEHNGVLFPPKYLPHNVKILYKGEPVELTSYQEEISTYWAGLLDNDLSTKEICRKNFFNEFKAVMGNQYEHANFEDFDFTPIKDYLAKQKEINKNKSPEEKKVRKKLNL